jgi:hypothetical protein
MDLDCQEGYHGRHQMSTTFDVFIYILAENNRFEG